MAAWREVARMGTRWEVAHTAARLDLNRSRHQQLVAGRRQPHSLAYKMRGESQLSRQIRK